MASGIAHDFNNALTQVLGFSELLLARPDALRDPGTVREYLELMHTAAEDAAHMVGRLREFARDPEGDGANELLDIGELAREVIALTRPRWKDQAQAGGSTIRVETELAEVQPVSGRRAELRAALTNLIFNAIDALPEGGTITLRTRALGEQVVLEIVDTGVGMAEAVRRRCLEPFFTTKGERGTGLGLAMVRGIVLRHGGAMSLHSALSRGTTVRLCFPVAGCTTQDAPSGAVVGPPVPLRVLVVDDEPPIRRLLGELLTSDGHLVEAAADGREALEKLRGGRFDVVVTDRAMPGLNGDDLATAIRRLAPDAPIIMLTGFGAQMDADGERPLGVDLILNKPVTLDGLRRALAAVAPPRPGAAAPPEAGQAPSRTVLVVDDDDWIRDILETVLQSAGYDVVVARDGVEALERLEHRVPDLILLDMMMPRMDGFAFAEELRKRGLRSAIPIVVMSAVDQTRQKTLLIDPAGFLRKPFDMPVLLEQVARLSAA